MAVRFAVAAAMLVATMFGQAQAALIVDQQQLANTSGGSANYSFGQSFTPAASSIEWAEFVLLNQQGPGSPVDLQLSVLDGLVGTYGMDGTVLASSAVVTLSDSSFSNVLFQLPTPLTLTPGNTYVLQVNILTPGASVEWRQTFNSAYVGGQALQAAYSAAFLANEDFVFREGTGSPDAPPTGPVVPEPTSMALAGFAGIGLALRAWRRRQQPA